MNEQPRALNENVSLGARVCDPQPVCLRVWLRLTEPRSSRVQTRHHFISPLPGRANPTFKHKGKNRGKFNWWRFGFVSFASEPRPS